MAQKGVLWNGKYYTIPAAASRIDSSALARTPLGGDNVLVVMGIMTGLFAPKTLQGMSDPSLALNLLDPATSEEARLAAQLVFDPAPGSPGASQVYFVGVNPSTPATLTLSSALVLTSYLYGLSANQLMAKVEAGTTGKKVTVQFGANPAEVYDNLTKSSFSIVYTGSGSAAVMTITPNSTTHTLTTTCTGATGDNLALDLDTYTTIQALVAAINSTGKYTAVVTTTNPNDSTMQLDGVTAQDIKTAPGYTAYSDLQAMIDGINAKSGYCSAAEVTDATTIPANAAWTYFAGGANGTVTNNDWQAAFDLCKTIPIQQFVVLTSDASIHSMLSAHLDYMSGPDGKSERRGFVGGALQPWISEANRTAALLALTTAASNLNDDRVVHATLGSYHYDPNGKNKLYPGYITACMYAGLASGSSPVEPLTRKHLRCNGLEIKLRPNEVAGLIDAGLAPPIADDVMGAGYCIARQVTTWNQDSDLYRIEFSVGRGSDYIASQVRKRHAEVIGKAGTADMDVTILNITNGVLQDALTAGYIRSYDPKATVLRVDNTIRYIDYSAQPILPINFIFSTYHLLPTVQTIQL